MTLKIGNLTIKNNIFLAPMAGVTDLPFRLLCKEQGCGLMYTEMVSAKALYYKNKNTEDLLATKDIERPIAVQIFGSDLEIMSQMAKEIEKRQIDIIDINMGCPVPKVVNNKEGSALMLEPELVAKIVKKISSSIKKPLTVKIRKGFNDQNINAVKIAQIAEDNGAAAITVHGRTREQYYSGTADYEIIKQVKKAVKIPVIGNGDVFSPVDAEKLFNYTECDAIMIGRGAKGNPWIFSSVLHYQKTKEILPNPPIDVIINTIIKHTNMMIQLKGEFIGIREMRKHFAWYTKGLKNSANLRNLINQTNNYNEFKKIVEELSNYISL